MTTATICIPAASCGVNGAYNDLTNAVNYDVTVSTVCTVADVDRIQAGVSCAADPDGCAAGLLCAIDVVQVADGVSTKSICVAEAKCGTSTTANDDTAQAYTITANTVCEPRDPLVQDASCLSWLGGCDTGLQCV